MKFSDPLGHLRLLLCSAVLFVNHGLRDYLITGLPSIASVKNSNYLLRKKIDIFIELKDESNNGSHPQTFAGVILNADEGWTSALVGGTLSSIYLGLLIPLIASPFVIQRVPIKYILVFSLATSGILSLFMELAANGNASNILILRILQGILQGWCYPVVFYILDDVTSSTYAVPFFFIFIAPWLGSGVGTLLGWAKNPFWGAYFFGSLSILLGILAMLIPLKLSDSKEKPKYAWQECFYSKAVWACILLQMGIVWVLHLFIVGLAFTLDFKLNRRDLIWTVFVVILIGGIVTRLVAMAAMSLLRNHFFSPLNRRRAIVISSSTVLLICLLTIGISGVDHEFVLFGMSMLGIAGVGVGLVGIRLNLHDLGPLFPTPLLFFGSAASSVGAGLSSLLFPIIAQIGDIMPEVEIDGSLWRAAWMTPMIIVFIVCGVHLFFVSVIPLPHQTLITVTKGVPQIQSNGMAAAREEDLRSFKSMKSALSFKSAVSKQRTTSFSFKTVDENDEADLQTVRDSTEGEDCVSIIDDDNEDMQSFRSGALSFKSATGTRLNSIPGRDLEVVLSAQELDRTSAWLSTHHHTGDRTDQQHSVEKEKIEKNLLFALQW